MKRMYCFPLGRVAHVLVLWHSFAPPDCLLAGHTQADLSVKEYEQFSSAVFRGAVDYRDDHPESRGGFAAFRTRPDERVRDLSAFSAVEMRIKSDGRP